MAMSFNVYFVTYKSITSPQKSIIKFFKRLMLRSDAQTSNVNFFSYLLTLHKAKIWNGSYKSGQIVKEFPKKIWVYLTHSVRLT